MSETGKPETGKPETGLLDGLVVLDLSQFLAGPLAALRLGDLGARVIKVERPGAGDLCRGIYLDADEVGGDSTLFHAINRDKEGIALDFKAPSDLARLHALAARADVVIQNFRPGVAARLGLDDAALRRRNPALVCGSITGYGDAGPWVDRPGQDLLAQARSGLMWLSGDAQQGPVPVGLAVADMLAGHTLVQGILAALVRRFRTGAGASVETSLLEVLVDLQFEVLTTHLNDGGRMPHRGEFRSAHAYLAAPYGAYPTEDGFLALAMMPLARLAALIDLPALADLAAESGAEFTRRDAAKRLIAAQLATRPTAAWLAILEPADVWCAEVLDWPALLRSEGFRALDMLQSVRRPDGTSLRTTRIPLRVDGVRRSGQRAAPALGADTATVLEALT